MWLLWPLKVTTYVKCWQSPQSLWFLAITVTKGHSSLCARACARTHTLHAPLPPLHKLTGDPELHKTLIAQEEPSSIGNPGMLGIMGVGDIFLDPQTALLVPRITQRLPCTQVLQLFALSLSTESQTSGHKALAHMAPLSSSQDLSCEFDKTALPETNAALWPGMDLHPTHPFASPLHMNTCALNRRMETMPQRPLLPSPLFSPHQHPTPNSSSSLPEPAPETTSTTRSLNPYQLMQVQTDMWVGVGNITYMLELSSMSVSTQLGYQPAPSE